MDNKLKLNSVEITDWMNVEYLKLQLNGDSVTLRGMNGAGKSAILYAILAGIQGKAAYPKGFDYQQLIRAEKGVESAKIKLDLGDGRHTSITTQVSVTQSDMYLNIKTFDDKGKAVSVPGGVATFAKKMVGAIGFDPTGFGRKSAKEKLAIVYELCPSLEGDLKKNSVAYQEAKNFRADTLRETQRLEGALAVMPLHEDVPEELVDPAVLAKKLQDANEHNAKHTAVIDGRGQALIEMDGLSDSIGSMESELSDIQKRLADVQKAKIAMVDKIRSIDEVVAKHKNIDVEPIIAEISACNVTNEKIRQSTDRKKTIDAIAESKRKYSEGLQNMKTIDANRLDIVKNAELPVPGMSIGEGCLMYPDPETFKLTNVDMLSAGQFWPFVTELYCALNPSIQFMIVGNLHDMDKENAKAITDAASRHGLQLITHQTISEKAPVGMQIHIVDGGIKKGDRD